MKITNRIIPCLLLSDGGLVKTSNFKNPVYIGDPINAIKIFNDKEVDELIVLDINCSKRNQEPDYELIEQFASECFMPLCYGGGVLSLEIADKLFSIGVEKISLQSILFKDISVLKKISEKYGRQSVVASIDVSSSFFGKYKIFVSSNRKTSDIQLFNFINLIQEIGVGEIFLNCVDNEGLMKGLNLELIKKIRPFVNVPLVVTGGVGSMEDINSGFNAGADAVSVGSFFVYHGLHKGVLITYPSQEEIRNLIID